MKGPRDEELFPDVIGPAEQRVTALRDTLLATAAGLNAGTTRPGDAAASVQASLDALEADDLGGQQSLVSRQLRACLRHLGGIPADAAPAAHGLANDARFLRDLAEFLTRKFGLREPEASLAPEEPRARPAGRQLPVLPQR